MLNIYSYVKKIKELKKRLNLANMAKVGTE